MRSSFAVPFIVLMGLMLVGMPALTQESGGNLLGGTSDWIGKILTFIQTIAEYIGKGLVGIINQVANVKLDQLQEPLGYLGVLTLFLGALSMISAAKKILWFVVMLGWGLIIIRIVLEVLNKQQI